MTPTIYIKSFFRVAVNMYVRTYLRIFQGLDERGGRKLRTDTHIHTHGTTTVKIIKIIRSTEAHTCTYTYTVEPPNSGCVGNFDDVPYSEVER